MEPNPRWNDSRVLNCYWAVSGDRIVELGTQAAQDARVGQLGQPSPYRLVERHRPLLDQEHGGHPRYRLGHRRDTEDGVPLDWFATEGLVADGLDVDVASSSDQGYHPGNFASFHMTDQRPVQYFDVVVGLTSGHIARKFRCRRLSSLFLRSVSVVLIEGSSGLPLLPQRLC